MENNVTSKFKEALSKEIGNSGVLSKGGSDASLEYLDLKSSIPEEKVIKKPKKKSNVKDLVGKTKMNLPIGKLYSMGKTESKEATGSGSAGGYEQPLFSTTKKEIEEKWSKKYKDSINCKNPKGFSQRAHCQGKKKKTEGKKTETKEATGASSAGSYVTPAAWAKSTKKKDWRGKSKTQIPGGKFVQVKKKCKTFPYCNQGDIKALNIFENPTVKKIIKEISDSYGLTENIVKKIVLNELKNKKRPN